MAASARRPRRSADGSWPTAGWVADGAAPSAFAMDDAFRATLLGGDTDALRLHLKQLAVGASAAPAHADDQDDDAPHAAVNSLVEKAGVIADDLLARGLPHLEREAAAAAAAAEQLAAHKVSHAARDVPELGLTLCMMPVMSQPIWPAAVALGKWLRERAAERCAGVRCIELGAGGGAPGLVALAAGASHFLATEADESLLPLLEANCTANPGGGGGTWAVAALDWCDVDAVRRVAAGSPDAVAAGGNGFDLVLAADCLYSVGDIRPLVRAACDLMRRGERSRFVLARSAWFEELQPTFVAFAEEAGLMLCAIHKVDARLGAEGESGGAADHRGADDSGLREQEPPAVLEFAWAVQSNAPVGIR